MIDAPYLQAHRTASRLGGKKESRPSDRTATGGMNTKLQPVTANGGRFFITAGQISGYTGAARSTRRLAEGAMDAGTLGLRRPMVQGRAKQKGIKPCIPGRKSRSIRLWPASWHKSWAQPVGTATSVTIAKTWRSPENPAQFITSRPNQFRATHLVQACLPRVGFSTRAVRDIGGSL